MPEPPSTDQPVRVVHVPVLDTGIGKAAGYGSDLDLIAAHEAQRAELHPAVLERMDAIDRALAWTFLG